MHRRYEEDKIVFDNNKWDTVIVMFHPWFILLLKLTYLNIFLNICYFYLIIWNDNFFIDKNQVKKSSSKHTIFYFQMNIIDYIY